MTAPTRFTFTVEATMPAHRTEKEALEWVQKFFEFFHPKLEAKVKLDGQAVTVSKPEKSSLLD